MKLGITLKNRIMSTSHAIVYQYNGKPKRYYQAYHERKARGDLALTMWGCYSSREIPEAIRDSLRLGLTLWISFWPENKKAAI